MKVLISQEEANKMFAKMIYEVFLGTYQVESVEYQTYPDNHFEITLKEIDDRSDNPSDEAEKPDGIS